MLGHPNVSLDWKGSNWYRFGPPAGTKAPDRPPATSYGGCNTSLQGWIQGIDLLSMNFVLPKISEYHFYVYPKFQANLQWKWERRLELHPALVAIVRMKTANLSVGMEKRCLFETVVISLFITYLKLIIVIYDIVQYRIQLSVSVFNSEFTLKTYEIQHSLCL